MNSSHATHCIRVNKVYDWVARQVHIPLNVKAENLQMACSMELKEFSQLGEDVEINCFLADENGNRLNPKKEGSISCQEIMQAGGRKNVTATFPNGNRVILQKVKLFKRGYVVVEANDKKGNRCQTEPIPFHFEEAFLLCAPPGTFVDCHITYFDCTATIHCDRNKKLQNIFVVIDLCQEVQMEAIAKIALKARLKLIKKQLIKEIIEKEFVEKEEQEE